MIDPESVIAFACGFLVLFVIGLVINSQKPKKSRARELAMRQSLGRAGEGVRYYRPQRNWNRVINRIVNREVKAFPPGAIITQQKKYPDISFYQGSIDWDLMRSKTDAIIIRAGQNTWADSMFETNYLQAKKYGMLRGIYYFYDDRASPQDQADKLLELIGDDLPELEIYADWEKSYGGEFGGIRNVVAFMQAIERALPLARVGMYTGYYWFVENSNAILNWSQYQYLKDKSLWLGYYAQAQFVKIPAPWTALTHWQYGTPAESWGQSSAEIDMNYWNGTTQEFYTRYQAVIEPPSDGGNMQVIQGEAIGNVTRRKTPAGESFSPARYLVLGDKIEADRNQYQWLHLTKINGVALTEDEWASAGASQQYIKWGWVEVSTEPPPDPEPEPTFPPVVELHYADGTIKRYVPE